jgi:hypothetical protein
MAQSALTVTPPNPSPPTNFSSTGATGPNPPNFTKTNYANPYNLSARASGANGTTLIADERPVQTIPGVGVNQSPPPYFDDGTGGARGTFATNTAALASGTGATSGGTENTYPGTDVTGLAVNDLGAVPASTSVANEGAGTETATWGPSTGANLTGYNAAVTIPGVVSTYSPNNPGTAWAEGAAGGPIVMTSDLGSFTGVANSPNAQHASSLSPAANPTLTSITPTTAVSGTGTVALTAVTGTNFTPQSVVYANGLPVPTVFVSKTTLTATIPKKATASPPTWPIVVVTGGVVVTAPQTFTWT